MALYNKTVILFLFFALIKCASSKKLENQNLPLMDIKKAVEEALPGGSRFISSNGREYYSKYFEPKKIENVLSESARPDQRSFAHVYILGDSRPYDIEVKVPIEHKISQKNQLGIIYNQVGWDNETALEILRSIYHLLDERRKKQNLFDDFRAF